MSDVSNGPGWWQASDGKWYPPEQQPNYEAASPPPSPSSSPSPARSSAGAFKFEMNRWSQVERITAIASLVLLIALFLPWFTVSASVYSASASGLTAHGYLYIVLILCLGILVDLVAKASFATMPFKLPLPEEQLLLIATGINAVLTVIAFLLKPGGDGLVGVGWGWGSFVALIAAIVAAFPTAAPAIKARRNK
jgi:hypothetical protein